jgi:hypothetical protein
LNGGEARALLETLIESREDFFGGFDHAAVRVLRAIRPEPPTVGIRRLKWDYSSLAGVISAQPHNGRRHVVLSRLQEGTARNQSEIKFSAMGARGDKKNSEKGEAIDTHLFLLPSSIL